MDVPRTPPRKPRRQRVLLLGAGFGLVVATLGLARLKPASPEVERSTLLIGAVRRGPMLRQVHANGTLVPESQRFVSAVTAGRVERVVVRPGATVGADDVLVELSNPDVQLEALDAERNLKLAEAELASLEASLEGARLAQEVALGAARTELREAGRAVVVADTLMSEGLTSAMDVEHARDRLAEAQERFELETRRLALANQALEKQIELRRADVERQRAIARFQGERVASMRVRAGQAGVVEQLDLQPGQWVQSGTTLARVATPDRLKAVLQVPETQARDLALGLVATVDTRNGVVRGHVARIDPGVQNGTVAVDVALDGALPRGARPDLGVDGTIEIERIASVLSVGRPATGGSEGSAPLFRLEPDGRSAVRVPVTLGRASFDAVEIVAGLKEGDQVILSEMSRFDHVDRVRLR